MLYRFRDRKDFGLGDLRWGVWFWLTMVLLQCYNLVSYFFFDGEMGMHWGFAVAVLLVDLLFLAASVADSWNNWHDKKK